MTLYVSKTGNDRNSGSSKSPFATLSAAITALRSKNMKNRKKIVLRKGVYQQTAIVLTSQDSGLTIEGAKNESVVLQGGITVTDWKKDGECFYAASLPGVKEGNWDFRTLLVNGKLRPRARFPETGTLQHLNEFPVRWLSSTAGGWERQPTDQELTTMRYKKGDLPASFQAENAEFTIFHQWDDSLVGCKSIHPKTQTIYFKSPCGHPPGAFSGWNPKSRTYIIWNIREGMTRPGQWYLDRARGKLVYWPMPGEKIQKLNIIAPTTESIFRIEGNPDHPVKDITIKNLTVELTTTPLVAAGFGAARLKGAINIRGKGERLCFTNLLVRNVGGIGLRAEGRPEEPLRGIHISNSVFRDCGAGGIFIRADHSILEESLVHRVGTIYPASLAASVAGRNSRISHNEIRCCPYTALHSHGPNVRIESNRMSDFMRELDDGAAIYIFAGNKTVYRNNIAIGSPASRRHLAHAYYLDEQSNRCIVENNLAINTRWPCHNHMSKNCVIRKNVFLDQGPSKLSFMVCRDFRFEQNLILARDKIEFLIPEHSIRMFQNNHFGKRSTKVLNNHLGTDGYTAIGTVPCAMTNGNMMTDLSYRPTASRCFDRKIIAKLNTLGIDWKTFAKSGRTCV